MAALDGRPALEPAVSAGTVIPGRSWSAIAAAWVLAVGVDFFLHGGLLSRLYLTPSPFLLTPAEAFRRIPLGYAAFFLLIFGLAWLIQRLGVRGAGAGFRLGLVAGAFGWGAFLIGLYSISTGALVLLAGWWVGQALELGLSGAVLGAAAAGLPRRRLWIRVGLAVLALVALTIVLQSLGVARADRVGDAAAAADGAA
jgi:hypothetical protein